MPVPLDRTAAWLNSHGDGAGLDFVHLGALARCWAAVGPDRIPAARIDPLLARIESHGPDGGYEGNARVPHGTAYGAFVARAYQDLGRTPPRPLELVRSLKRLETADGAWSNAPGVSQGALNATAGAVTLVRHLGVFR